MNKSDTSRQVTKWESLDRDILALIFSKLSLKDFTIHASRVCISWFIASHNITLWNTVDLAKAKLQEGLSLNNNILLKFSIILTLVKHAEVS